MDTVFIRGLRVDAIIGIHERERHTRQPLEIDLELGGDNRRAAASDAIADALDYAAVAERVQDFVGGSRFQLVETLAEELAALLRREFAVPWLRLRVAKPEAVPAARDVGVCIERGDRP